MYGFNTDNLPTAQILGKLASRERLRFFISFIKLSSFPQENPPISPNQERLKWSETDTYSEFHLLSESRVGTRT